MSTENKIIAIVGTTASGKTTLAVDLAYKFKGEVISADSRQVYKYMDIGTGKDIAEYTIRRQTADGRRQKIKIPYHCIDVVHPNTEFSLGKWLKQAEKAIKDIQGRGRVPILAGGTGLYTQALVDGYDLVESKPDKILRTRLEKMSAAKLFAKLEKQDKKFAENLHVSDQKNKRRLIRYIEIALKPGSVSSGSSRRRSAPTQDDREFLILGITWPGEVLKKRIRKRLVERLEKEDMQGEVERLHRENQVSWQRLINFGLEYKYLTNYLQDEIAYQQMVEELARAVYQFSRRQMTWLRRWQRQGRKIYWVKNKTEARKVVKEFLK